MKENTILVQKFSVRASLYIFIWYTWHRRNQKYLKLKMSKFEFRLRYQFENIITHVMVYTPYYNIIKFACDHLFKRPLDSFSITIIAFIVPL